MGASPESGIGDRRRWREEGRSSLIAGAARHLPAKKRRPVRSPESGQVRCGSGAVASKGRCLTNLASPHADGRITPRRVCADLYSRRATGPARRRDHLRHCRGSIWVPVRVPQLRGAKRDPTSRSLRPAADQHAFRRPRTGPGEERALRAAGDQHAFRRARPGSPEERSVRQPPDEHAVRGPRSRSPEERPVRTPTDQHAVRRARSATPEKRPIRTPTHQHAVRRTRSASPQE